MLVTVRGRDAVLHVLVLLGFDFGTVDVRLSSALFHRRQRGVEETGKLSHDRVYARLGGVRRHARRGEQLLGHGSRREFSERASRGAQRRRRRGSGRRRRFRSSQVQL